LKQIFKSFLHEILALWDLGIPQWYLFGIIALRPLENWVCWWTTAVV